MLAVPKYQTIKYSSYEEDALSPTKKVKTMKTQRKLLSYYVFIY